MTRMSKSISLALVGTSLLLAGCGKRRDQMTEEERREYDARHSGGRGYISGHGFFWGGGGRGSSSSSGHTGSPSSSVSSRGGFGGSGHAVSS